VVDIFCITITLFRNQSTGYVMLQMETEKWPLRKQVAALEAQSARKNEVLAEVTEPMSGLKNSGVL
jgi:hypothetical protein